MINVCSVNVISSPTNGERLYEYLYDKTLQAKYLSSKCKENALLYVQVLIVDKEKTIKSGEKFNFIRRNSCKAFK